MKKILTILVVLWFPGYCLSQPRGLKPDNYPKVDGSTSTQTLQSLVKSRILGSDQAVPHSDTEVAYTNLIDRKSDLILVARAPSREELQSAQRKGITLDARPVALDALVFLVHKTNPVNDLTLDQIRGIYSGKFTRWADLGIKGVSPPPREITAFLRTRLSGSEELMRSLVMKDVPIKLPPTVLAPPGPPGELVLPSMFATVERVAETQSGIAYSVFFYVKHFGRLLLVKEKVLAALVQRHEKRIKALEESDLRQKDPESWAELRTREQQQFLKEQEKHLDVINGMLRATPGLSEIKLIGVDGVEPTVQTIASRKYPFTAEVYVVVRGRDLAGSPAHWLRDWLLSPEGQKVINESGYVTPTSTAGLGSGAQEISAGNTARRLDDNQRKWTVFIKAKPEVLDRVQCVEYTLHPTFPDPVRRVCALGDSSRPFALSATGWGTFEIGIRVFMKDGTHRDLKHLLRF